MTRFAALALALLAATPLPAASAGAFDGTWNVTLACSMAPDGASGYTYQFGVQVVDGILHGERGGKGSAGWLALDGRIPADGKTTLTAEGLTGNPAFSVGRVQQLSPVRYHVTAQFGATHGTGSRVELRRCDLDFQRL